MGFSPVECVVRYVGMEDRYTLKHSYVRLRPKPPLTSTAEFRCDYFFAMQTPLYIPK